MRALLAFGCVSVAVASSAASANDLRRARSKIPGERARASGHLAMTMKLNSILRADKALTVRPCEEFSVEELVDVQRALFAARDPALEQIYRQTSDNRQMGTDRTEGPEQLEELLAKELAILRANPSLKNVSRDGKCHEAVMWMTHQVAAGSRGKLADILTLPLLPERAVPHSAADFADGPAPAAVVDQVLQGYKLGIGCGACHDSGPYQAAASLTAQGEFVAALSGKCCESCTSPQNKYYMVDLKKGHCSETCLQDKHVTGFKIFWHNLTKAEPGDSSPCTTHGFKIYAGTEKHGLGSISMEMDTYDPSGTLPLFPPPIAPVWPARFSAKTFGTITLLGRDPLAGGHKNYTADWFYDWPNARHLYNGSETFNLKNGTVYTKSYIRTWHGATAKDPSSPVTLCDIDTTVANVHVCTCTTFPKFLLAQIERPDGFVRAKMTLVAREKVSGSMGQRHVDAVIADHYLGPVFKAISPAPFELWQDPETNFPVLFTGPVGYEGDSGSRYFSDVRAFGESMVTDDIFDGVDYSSCNKPSIKDFSALPSHYLQGPSLLDVHVMEGGEVLV